MSVDADGKGLRYNAGKAPMHLLPVDALLALADVYAFGAKKYAPRNWERGMDWSKCYDSLMRHLFAYQQGIDRDEETKLLHTAHLAWNAIALLTYQIRGIGNDDRLVLEGEDPNKLKERAQKDMQRSTMSAAEMEALVACEQAQLKAAQSLLPQILPGRMPPEEVARAMGVKMSDCGVVEFEEERPFAVVKDFKVHLGDWVKFFANDDMWFVTGITKGEENGLALLTVRHYPTKREIDILAQHVFSVIPQEAA